MKQVKIYDYNFDNFIRGRLVARSLRGAHRRLRKMFGCIGYWKLRKYLTITEVEDVK